MLMIKRWNALNSNNLNFIYYYLTKSEVSTAMRFYPVWLTYILHDLNYFLTTLATAINNFVLTISHFHYTRR